MSNSSPAHIVSQFLEKMASSDSDFRFMAANDLATVVAGDQFILDDGSERKLVAAVLKLIDDKNGEVQNMAAKCLIPLVRKAKETQIRTIMDELCKMFTTTVADRDGLRDIAGIALKTVVVEIPLDATFTGSLTRRLLPNLLEQLHRTTTSTTSSSDQSQLDVIDILSDIFSRLGQFLSTPADDMAKQLQQNSIQTLYPLLDNARSAVRKRSITAIESLVPHIQDNLFAELVKKIISDIIVKGESCQKFPANLQKLQSLIACTSAIGRSCSFRFAPYLHEVFPLVLNYVNLDDNDLREQCIQTIDSFILRNPAAIKTYIPTIIQLGLEYVKYDPNYNEDDADDSEDQDEDEDEEDDEDHDYSDDDDVSWKVRRASAKLLSSLIGTHSEFLSELYAQIGPTLIRRFTEREESVRIDVFNTFLTLLQQSIVAKHQKSDTVVTTSPLKMVGSVDSQIALQLNALVPRIVKVLSKQLVGKSIPTRLSGFQLLKQLVLVLSGGLDDSIALIVPAIEYPFIKTPGAIGGTYGSTTNTNLKIEVLEFLKVFLENHSPELFHPYMNHLVPSVLAAGNDHFYKIRAGAFSVMSVLIKTLRPFCNVVTGQADTSSTKQVVGLTNKSAHAITPAEPPAICVPFINSIFNFTLECVKATDTSVEVKEAAIGTLGVLVHQACDLIPPVDLSDKVVPILVDRLKNEVTRLMTIRCITYMAESPFANPPLQTLSAFNPHLAVIVSEISANMRKTHRQLRIASVVAVETLVRKFNCQSMYPDILDLLYDMLTAESDLQILPISLSLLISMMQKGNTTSTVQLIQSKIVHVIITIVCDMPHLVSGGASLDLLVDFWRILASAENDAYSAECIQELLSKVQCRKEAYPVVSKSIAALTTNKKLQVSPLLDKFITDVIATPGEPNAKYLALLSIGEIGHYHDLFQTAPTLHTTLFNLFDSPSEEIKNAAAFSLGHIAIGNMPLYLPLIVEAVRGATVHQYLSLLALKEVIEVSLCTESTQTAMSAYFPGIWKILFEKTDTDLEDSTCNVVSECLGLISTSDAQSFLPQLQSQLSSSKPTTRVTVVSAVRYTFSVRKHGGSDAYISLLEPLVLDILRLIQDEDLNVRRVTIGALNAVAHSKPQLICQSLGELLPLLYKETLVNEAYIHVVEMGPFKHKVDTGLDTRKAAFECMYTLLDSCISSIEIHAFIERAIAGIADPAHEIKIISHLMLQRLATVNSMALSVTLDTAVDALRATLTSKTKPSAVKQEIEKHRELLHSCCKTVIYMARTQSSTESGNRDMPKFAGFLKEVKMPTALCFDIFALVEKEVAVGANVSGNHA
ncbi:hypothetical protein QVD99_007840 [Batrachochytrium dendrobatidis]|nr:hypothetical protein QVD99_007840 [Batrachochytrium dendrobatidis]